MKVRLNDNRWVQIVSRVARLSQAACHFSLLSIKT
jgi:hypothetical protein